MTISPLLSLTRWDMDLQRRSHFYAATAFVTAIIATGAALIPDSSLFGKLLSFLIFADPAIIGLTFVGAFILMEKGTNTLAALAVSPLQISTYLQAKILSFSFLGVIAGGVIAIIGAWSVLSLSIIIPSLLLSNIITVEIGIVIVSGTKSINDFLARLILVSLILNLPLIAFFDIAPPVLSSLLYLIPSYAMLVLFEAALVPHSLSIEHIMIALGYLGVCTIIGWIWCHRAFKAHMATGGL